MKNLASILIFILSGAPCLADTLVAARTIRSHTVLTAADLKVIEADVPGALTSVEFAIGQEARVILYPGRPILPGDIAPAALVERNQIVEFVFARNGLRISTDARAMSRGGVGDAIRVMNLASRTTIAGVVMEDGTVVALGGRP